MRRASVTRLVTTLMVRASLPPTRAISPENRAPDNTPTPPLPQRIGGSTHRRTHPPRLPLAPGHTRLGWLGAAGSAPCAVVAPASWQHHAPAQACPRAVPSPPPGFCTRLRIRASSSCVPGTRQRRRSTHQGGCAGCCVKASSFRQRRAYRRLLSSAHRRHGGRHLWQRAAIPPLLPGHRCVTWFCGKRVQLLF
jgi:hypothetical protein